MQGAVASISSCHWSVVLSIAGKTAASSDTELAALVLLTTPDLPEQDARRAITGGLRVSYQQFVLAARLRIPGIEVWPRAHRQQPIISSWGHYVAEATNSVQSVADCVCCNFEYAGMPLFEQILPKLSQQQILELLYISVNLTETPTRRVSVFAYTMLQGQYERLNWRDGPNVPHVPAKSVHELLVTAITRCSYPAVNALSYFPAARQMVSGRYTFTPSGRHLVNLPNALIVNNLAGLFMDHLRFSKETRNSSFWLYQQKEAPYLFHRLCQVVCGRSACEAALLHVMLEITSRCASPHHGRGFAKHLATMCELPMAQQLTGDPVFALLEAAVQIRCAAAAKLVTALPGASMLSPQQVSELVAAGAAELCCIPGHRVADVDARHVPVADARPVPVADVPHVPVADARHVPITANNTAEFWAGFAIAAAIASTLLCILSRSRRVC